MRKLLMLASVAIAGGLLARRALRAYRENTFSLINERDQESEREPAALPEDAPRLGIDAKVSGDADVLGILAAFDAHQHRCAELALERGLDDTALGLAERLRKEHAELEEEVRARIEEREPEPSQRRAVAEFESRCDLRYDALRAADDVDFASVHLVSARDEHLQMLDLIDTLLEPAASGQTTVELLMRHRTHVASHLSEIELFA